MRASHFTSYKYIFCSLLLLCCLCLTQTLIGQTQAESLEEALAYNSKKQQLLSLNELSKTMLATDPKKALKHAREAVELAEELIDEEEEAKLEKQDHIQIVEAFYLLGQAWMVRERYDEAEDAFESSLEYAEEYDYEEGKGNAQVMITHIENEPNKPTHIFPPKGVFDFKELKNIDFSRSSATEDILIETQQNIARVYAHTGQHKESLKEYNKLIKELEKEKKRKDKLEELIEEREDLEEMMAEMEEDKDKEASYGEAFAEEISTSVAVGAASTSAQPTPEQPPQQARPSPPDRPRGGGFARNIKRSTDQFSLRAQLRLANIFAKTGMKKESLHQFDKVANTFKERDDMKSYELAMEEKRKWMEAWGEEVAAGVSEPFEEIVIQGIETPPVPETPSTIFEDDDFTVMAIESAQEVEELKKLREQAKRLERQSDYKKSLDIYKEYQSLRDMLAKEEQASQMALMEKSYELENQENELMLLRKDQDILRMKMDDAREFRNNLMIGLALLLSLAVALFFLYHNKQRAHGRLKTAYDDLGTTKDQLAETKGHLQTLLNQQVSGDIAHALISSIGASAVQRRFVCIMFLDIREFTPFAESKSPEEIIKYQNDVFGFMIDIIESHHGNINQFMGDGFMATFGAPISHGNDCENAMAASEAIIEEVERKNAEGLIPQTRIGIGLHAGHVVMGNVGNEKRMQFSITGNPVITAARIEQLNKEYGSQLLISEEVFEKLEKKEGREGRVRQAILKGRKEEINILELA